MTTGMNFLTKEDIKMSIKMKDYYTIEDVKMVLEDEDFDNYPTEFLQYMLSVLSAGRGYHIPWGEEMKDLTVQSVSSKWSDEDYRNKVHTFLKVLVKRLTSYTMGLIKNGNTGVRVTQEEFGAIESLVIRVYKGVENPGIKLNQLVIMYIRGLTSSSDKITAYEVNRCTQFMWDRYYDAL